MSEETPSVKFEFLDINPQTGAKRYYIEAIHVTITGNRRKYTKEELIKAAPTLSNKPLNEDHDHSKFLPYPANRTLEMAFNFDKMGVVGKMEIADIRIQQEIAEGKIWKLSIEQKPRYENCQCNKAEGCFCEQIGIQFNALALLHRGHFPGDPKTVIREESLKETPLSEIIQCERQAKKEEASTSNLEAERVDSSLEKHQTEENQMAEATATNEVKKESTTPQSAAPVINFDFKPVVEALNEQFKNSHQVMLEKLSELIGVVQKSVKTESASSPASKVNNDGKNSYFESTVVEPAKWFEDVKNNANKTNYVSWNLNKEAYLNSLEKAILRTPENGMKREAITFNAVDKPQVFDKQVFVLPGGRTKVPIRQFLNVKVIQNADRVNWYKIDSFDVDDTTVEGTEPTNETQTISKVQAIPSIFRAVQTVKYSDIEDAPFDLLSAINEAAMIGTLNVEAKEVLTTTYNAITPTNVIRGDTGELLAAGNDDISSITGLSTEGILAGLELLETEGYDTTPGNVVLFAHPRAVRQLILSTAGEYYTSDGRLTMRDIGVLERRFGVDIVPTTAVAFNDGINADVYRNVMAIKGEALGLAVAANLQLEAEKEVKLHAIKVGARHRIKGSVIDEKKTVRISTSSTIT